MTASAIHFGPLAADYFSDDRTAILAASDNLLKCFAPHAPVRLAGRLARCLASPHLHRGTNDAVGQKI
jgi:hypothetical protein